MASLIVLKLNYKKFAVRMTGRVGYFEFINFQYTSTLYRGDPNILKRISRVGKNPLL